MSRTKSEVIAFLDSIVGSTPVEKNNANLNGQCVTLIKVLMEFLGVADPYKARGNATDAGNAYIKQGIGVAGRGWLTIVVNHDMGYIGGVHYGHIWIDLMDTANYESNGAKALKTTKNTRPISQGQQFINFDQWIKEDDVKITRDQIYWHYWTIAGVEPSEQEIKNYEGTDYVWATESIKQYFANAGRGYYTYRVNAEANDVSQDAQIKSLQQSLAEKPKEVIVTVEKPVPVEIVKGDEERTAGDLIIAGLKKLLRVK